MTNRKLQALRNLAERPGTPAEGALAREILARLEKQPIADDREEFWNLLDAHAAGKVSADDFLEALRRYHQLPIQIPTHWSCACGAIVEVGRKCCNSVAHDHIQICIRTRYKKGDRVFYNYWAYSPNQRATVVGYVRPKPENGSHPWAWLTLKFDHLQSNRQVPVRSAKGWHLTHEPLSDDEARRMSRP